MKIGILGGTFDPIHCGHTFLATRVKRFFGLDEIHFMPAKQPPHKDKIGISHAFHRFTMVALALLECPSFYASVLELEKESASFTIDTLEELGRRFPEHGFCFLAGSDSLRELHLWKEYDKLLRNYCLIFVQRPEARVEVTGLALPTNLKKAIQFVTEDDKPDIQPGHSYLVEVDALPVSSTSIRKLISSGMKPSPRQLSPRVFQYIRKYRLYEGNQKNPEKGL